MEKLILSFIVAILIPVSAIAKERVVLDERTKLIWQYNDKEDITQTAALAYCNDLVYAGERDWRLPTKDELIVAYRIVDKLNAYSSYYWSSTTNSFGENYAWSVYLASGDAYNAKKGVTFFVRCVRGNY